MCTVTMQLNRLGREKVVHGAVPELLLTLSNLVLYWLNNTIHLAISEPCVRKRQRITDASNFERVKLLQIAFIIL